MALDLDGDGDVDVVASDPSGPALQVFFQSTPGVFGLEPPIYVDRAPSSVTAADLNGDGYLDLVSASSTVGLTLFFQVRPGKFEPERQLSVRGARSVVAADIDGDGDMDLVSANGSRDTLAVFLQEGPGVFPDEPLPPIQLPAGSDPVAVVAADLDADGYVDLVSANEGSNNVSVFWQSPTLEFQQMELGGEGTTDGPRSVTVADLDGDGDLDLVSANGGASVNLTVFLQRPTGEFDPPLILEDPETEDRPVSVTVADVDGDGDLDVASANERGHRLTVYYQTSPGRFDEEPSLILGDPATGTRWPRSLVARDIDGDGEVDVASANQGGVEIFFAGH